MIETTNQPPVHRAESSSHVAAKPASGVALLEPRASGPARRMAHALSGLHPAVAFLVAAITAWILVAGISILAGLLVTDVLVPIDAVEDADTWLPEELERQRTSTLTDVSSVASELGGGFVLSGILLVTTIACAVMRRWRIAAFLLFALMLESATYRVTTILAPRERPDVERLESLDAAASYPSGHVAASIAVYVGLAAIVTSRIQRRGARIAIWVLALTMPPVVALARMYRGMHHPLDVLGGVLVGTLALFVVALFAARVAGAVDASRGRPDQREELEQRGEPDESGSRDTARTGDVNVPEPAR